MALIYILEDDESIRELVIYALKNSHFEAEGFEEGDEFFKQCSIAKPDLILLDIMLPGEDGLAILRKLKEKPETKDIPVIMLTAKSSEIDKVKGLDLGADDYVTKPFGVMELISRIKAVMRRTNKNSSDNNVLEFKDILLDLQRHEVLVSGVPCHLTYKEFELLKYLLANKEIALSRENIMEKVWGFDFEGESRTVDMHIKTLRQKLGSSGQYIKTVRNVGYKIGE